MAKDSNESPRKNHREAAQTTLHSDLPKVKAASKDLSPVMNSVDSAAKKISSTKHFDEKKERAKKKSEGEDMAKKMAECDERLKRRQKAADQACEKLSKMLEVTAAAREQEYQEKLRKKADSDVRNEKGASSDLKSVANSSDLGAKKLSSSKHLGEKKERSKTKTEIEEKEKRRQREAHEKLNFALKASTAAREHEYQEKLRNKADSDARKQKTVMKGLAEKMHSLGMDSKQTHTGVKDTDDVAEELAMLNKTLKASIDDRERERHEKKKRNGSSKENSQAEHVSVNWKKDLTALEAAPWKKVAEEEKANVIQYAGYSFIADANGYWVMPYLVEHLYPKTVALIQASEGSFNPEVWQRNPALKPKCVNWQDRKSKRYSTK